MYPSRPDMPPPWMRPAARPPCAFVPRWPPPRGFPFPLILPRGLFPRFVPPRPLPFCRPVVDTEQLWLDTFKRTQCQASSPCLGKETREPPLRRLRRRIAQTQQLVDQLKAAATELAAVETKRETRRAVCLTEDGTPSMETLQLQMQYDRQLETCESLKKQLEAMNATSGLFPEQQFSEIRDFAMQVNKKKAYRKRAKRQRRADARLRRAIDSNICKDAESTGEDKVDVTNIEHHEKKKTVASPLERVAPKQPTATCVSATERNSLKQSLDPETLTIDALIAVRRAWDAFIVVPQTPGASTIPPHFVPPPPAPSTQWATYVAIPAHLGVALYYLLPSPTTPLTWYLR